MTTRNNTVPRRSVGATAAWVLLGAAISILVLGGSLLAGVANASRDRVLPGVAVGGIRLDGLTLVGAQARLDQELPALPVSTIELRLGEQVIKTDSEALGRRYDTAALAAAALAFGRDGNPLSSALAEIQAFAGNAQIPLTTTSDPAALDTALTQVNGLAQSPVDATVVSAPDGFAVTAARAGRAIDLADARAQLVAYLASNDFGPATLSLRDAPAAPVLDDAAAMTARDEANRMLAAGFVLNLGGDETRPLTATELASLLDFTPAGDSYTIAPAATAIGNLVLTLAGELERAPREASYKLSDGKVVAVDGLEGRILDQGAAVESISAALTAGDGGADLAFNFTEPNFTTAEAQASAPKVRKISTWTTSFLSGPSNFYGKNITIPAKALNGYVVSPGELFDFWTGIGPVTKKEGYGAGGAIINGKVVAQGALAGGICSTSTTLFNAVMRAGYDMEAKRNHTYYIRRYPIGLDATVYSDVGYVQTMSFRNDTSYPLLIRAYTTTDSVRFDIWSVPTGRTVTLSKPKVTNSDPAHVERQYTSSLPAGATQVVHEYHDGFDAVVIRTVTAKDGAVLHEDTWKSHYIRVDGLVLVGR